MCVDWIRLAQSRVQRRVLVNTVMNCRVSEKAGYFLTSSTTISFVRRTLLRYILTKMQRLFYQKMAQSQENRLRSKCLVWVTKKPHETSTFPEKFHLLRTHSDSLIACGCVFQQKWASSPWGSATLQPSRGSSNCIINTHFNEHAEV